MKELLKQVNYYRAVAVALTVYCIALIAILSYYYPRYLNASNYEKRADINLDGKVDLQDFSILDYKYETQDPLKSY